MEIKCTFAQIFNQKTNQKTKQMKKLTQSVLAIIVVATSITACKKGDDDPTLSLRSRKGRFAGEWTVTQKEETSKTTSTYVPTFGTTGVAGYTTTSDDKTTMANAGTYNMTSATTSTLTGSTNNISTATGNTTTIKYTIEKDGTWTSEENYTITSSQPNNTSPAFVVNRNTKTTKKGTWQFLGKNKSLEEKKGESVLLSVTEETIVSTDVTTGVDASTSVMTYVNTYGKNENVMVWHISMLKNKEMAADFEMKSTYSPSFTYTDASGTVSGSYEPTFGGLTALSKRDVTGSGTMTFTQE